MFCRNCLTDHMPDETCDYMTINEFGEPVILLDECGFPASCPIHDNEPDNTE